MSDTREQTGTPTATKSLFGSQPPSWWNKPAPWRLATFVLTAVTAVMLLVVARPPSSSHYVGVLSAPGSHVQGFVVMASHKEIVAHALGVAPPQGRAFELWAVYLNV